MLEAENVSMELKSGLSKSEENSNEIQTEEIIEHTNGEIVKSEDQENLVKEEDVNKDQPIKSILKHGPLLTEKHVDFNTDKVEIIPFDETKDYTIEIQIVEKITPKIVSYRELFAQIKAAEAAGVEKS